ncbi:MAG: DNA-binding response regulator [Candidatus Melainabacteria bacterium HGW-Melainabacteria-1]|nr:MAG: DNA-binding response regulator [Spirochaetae bacterium HGW-Spirochaetae-3]PKL74203.1 MAG: DNA-binding response regulator [Candidatus Melainabacteria bacterium HGW-Melainabacteria-1]
MTGEIFDPTKEAERILIVEDDTAIAQGLEYQLRNERYRVFLAKNGKEALQSIQRDDPQLILLDIRLPDMSGFDICKIIRAEGRTIPILILSALDGESDRVLGLELGADDYVSKPYKLREVIARIRSALRRSQCYLGTQYASSSFAFGDIRIDFAKLRIMRGDRPVSMTPAEFHLVRMLTSTPGMVYSREMLIQAIYGESRFQEARSIDVHMHHIRNKLEADPKHPQWFLTVYGFGYRFADKAER